MPGHRPHKLDGSEHYVNGSPPLGLQNRIYICLRSAKHPQGFWTNSSQQYLDSGDRFGTSVSHAFASRAESEAYLLGAGQRWPVERLLSLLQPEHSLPLTFMYPSDSEEESEWRCSAYLLRARAGGFMTEQIVEFLATWVDAEGAPVALSHPASLPMETSRRHVPQRVRVTRQGSAREGRSASRGACAEAGCANPVAGSSPTPAKSSAKEAATSEAGGSKA